MVVGQDWGLNSGMVYTLQTHVEFTFNNLINIPHTCIIMMVSNDE